jgi:hypothetical protein
LAQPVTLLDQFVDVDATDFSDADTAAFVDAVRDAFAHGQVHDEVIYRIFHITARLQRNMQFQPQRFHVDCLDAHAYRLLLDTFEKLKEF